MPDANREPWDLLLPLLRSFLDRGVDVLQASCIDARLPSILVATVADAVIAVDGEEPTWRARRAQEPQPTWWIVETVIGGVEVRYVARSRAELPDAVELIEPVEVSDGAR